MHAGMLTRLGQWVRTSARRFRKVFRDPNLTDRLVWESDATRETVRETVQRLHVEAAAEAARARNAIAGVEAAVRAADGTARRVEDAVHGAQATTVGAVGEARHAVLAALTAARGEIAAARSDTQIWLASAEGERRQNFNQLQYDVAHQSHWVRDQVFSQLGWVRGDLADRIAAFEQAVARAEQRVWQDVNRATVQTILHSSAAAFFDCVLNGVRVKLPRETLRTMTHCIHGRLDGPFHVGVETLHLDWLRDKLRPSGTCLDVGAATGALALPVAVATPNSRVIAFEPSRTARRLLEDTLRENGVTTVTVVEAAVSDACGEARFAEMGADPAGERPFQPEKSSLAADSLEWNAVADTYTVPVTTLDRYFADRPGEAEAVRGVKIDVEGFEVHVLRGAAGFLARVKPYFAIDIHPDPFGPGSTEAGVRAILDPLGYTFEKPNHVLLCSPPQPEAAGKEAP